MTHSLHSSAASQQAELHIPVSAELSKMIYLFSLMVNNILKLDLQNRHLYLKYIFQHYSVLLRA